MHVLPALFVVVTVTAAANGDTKPSGISQFWTDDFKVFDKVYGKTSDKELYGITLPPSISFDITNAKTEASEKYERYLPNIDLADSDNLYFERDRYAKMFAKSLYDDKKPSQALQFISFSDFKPISENSDPETYNYLKRLETNDKYKIAYPDKGVGGFKPYKYAPNVEASDAYKSIQDILDAHEANKGKNKENEDLKTTKTNLKDNAKYYDKNNIKDKNRNKVRSFNRNGSKSRCNYGRCRKRQTSGVRYSRPYIRKIQSYRYSRR